MTDEHRTRDALTDSPSSRSAVPARIDGSLAPIDILAIIAEEDVWLANLKSERTRRAYKADVCDFMQSLDIRSGDELYRVKPVAVIAWRKKLEQRQLAPTTRARKLSALSSLFKHLVQVQTCEFNPVREVVRPSVSLSRGKTAALSQEQARMVLDASSADTLIGLRDRAILSVGMQLGSRRSEIAHLVVSDLHMHEGTWHMQLTRKGEREGQQVMNEQTVRRIRAYLEAASHASDLEGPMFRPTRRNGINGTDDMRRHLHAGQIDRLLKRLVKTALGIEHGFSAHSMRATFATTARPNGAKIERVKKALGHARLETTQLYFRDDDNPEEAAAAFVNY